MNYLVYAQFGVTPREMFPHMHTVDIASGLSLIDQTALTANMRNQIKPCSELMLRYASSIRVKPLGHLRL